MTHNHNLPQREIAIVGNARCYHTMDWYRTVQEIVGESSRIDFLTDLIDSESHQVLVRPDDPIVHLLNIDKLLFKNQSRAGNVWRNLVKLAVSPIQARRLRAYRDRHPQKLFHAHTMYYMFVCALAGVDFVGTPQGSEVLVRPVKNFLYKWFALKALRAAIAVSVDSAAMQQAVQSLSGVQAIVVQNGVEAEKLSRLQSSHHRNIILSPRGLTPLYRIQNLLDARNSSIERPSLTFVYPFWDDQYKAQCKQSMTANDLDLGRLSKEKLYHLLAQTKLVISIPRSDSSPRTIYEAIFAGACVAATSASWYEALPTCMKERVYLVDLESPHWIDDALDFADRGLVDKFIPTEAALELFSQERSMRRAIGALYGMA